MKSLLTSCKGTRRCHLSVPCWQCLQLIPARATHRLKINPKENCKVGSSQHPTNNPCSTPSTAP